MQYQETFRLSPVSQQNVPCQGEGFLLAKPNRARTVGADHEDRGDRFQKLEIRKSKSGLRVGRYLRDTYTEDY